MPQLANVWVKEDDWTGISSSSERKKRQNRLNQRAYRDRKHIRRFENAGVNADPDTNPPPILAKFSPVQAIPCPEARSSGCLATQGEAGDFLHRAFLDCRLNIHRPSDLPTLARLNVVNALALNGTVLGIPLVELYRDDLVSPFNLHGPAPRTAAALATIRNSLQPTALQRTIIHHPWIDLLPMPHLRDNILQGVEAGTVDEDALCRDLLGINEMDRTRAPLTVWGESWEADSWEVSAWLLNRWNALFRDCHDTIEATNYWRAKRGEMSIGFILDE